MMHFVAWFTSSCLLFLCTIAPLRTVASFQPVPNTYSSPKTSFPFIRSGTGRASFHVLPRSIVPPGGHATPHVSQLAAANMSGGQPEEEPWWEQPLKKVGSTTSIVVAGTFYVVLAYQRDAFMVSFFMGAISNGILSKVLKKILKQERPAELNQSELEVPPSDNGMPSSHAMSLGFIGTFTAINLPWTTPFLIGYGLISLVYRVRSNLHTLDQVLVGSVVGSLNGFLWFRLCSGNNPLGMDVPAWVSKSFLNQEGLLPWAGLVVPALVGAAVVGSAERRIGRALKKFKGD